MSFLCKAVSKQEAALYFTGLLKSCDSPDAGVTVAKSDSLIVGAKVVEVPAGISSLIVPCT